MPNQKKYVNGDNLVTYDGIIKNYVDAKSVELTQAEYDALPESEKLNGTEYFITNGQGGGGASSADDVSYDNTDSGLTATNVQDAIDEIAENMGGGTATDITYDNTDSGMTATNVQDAVDELSAGKANGEGLTFFIQNGILCVSTPPEPLVSFSTATDAQIASILDAYYNGEYTLAQIQEVWHVGDTRTIHLDAMDAPNPGSGTWAAQDITVTILDFDHTTLATPINGKTKACITVQTREVLSSDSVGTRGHVYIDGDDSNDTTFTKWSNLYMRTYLNDKVWGSMSSTFKASIKPSSHYRHTTYNGTESEQVTDNLFLPSYSEIYGTTSHGDYAPTSPVEGVQFTYYQTASNRSKYTNQNGSPYGSSGQYWWSGSASSYYDSDGYEWCAVKPGGTAYGISGGLACGLAPAWAM